jgi:hypothetical protein
MVGQQELSVRRRRLSIYMARENDKRTEWERLLLGNRAPLGGDLPEDLRKLLEQLKDRLREGTAPDAG